MKCEICGDLTTNIEMHKREKHDTNQPPRSWTHVVSVVGLESDGTQYSETLDGIDLVPASALAAAERERDEALAALETPSPPPAKPREWTCYVSALNEFDISNDSLRVYGESVRVLELTPAVAEAVEMHAELVR